MEKTSSNQGVKSGLRYIGVSAMLVTALSVLIKFILKKGFGKNYDKPWKMSNQNTQSITFFSFVLNIWRFVQDAIIKIYELLSLRASYVKSKLSSPTKTGNNSALSEKDKNANGKFCQICLNRNVLPKNMIKTECEAMHEFCVDCLYDSIRISVIDSTLETSSRVAHCPSCPNHIVSLSIVEKVLDKKGYSEFTNNLDTFKNEKEKRKMILERYPILLKNHNFKSTGEYIQCPSCSAQDNLEVSWFPIRELKKKETETEVKQMNTLVKERESSTPKNKLLEEYEVQPLHCTKCDINFCSHCHENPYHYTVSCSEYKLYKKVWQRWRFEDEAAYLTDILANLNRTTKEAAKRQANAIHNTLKSTLTQLIEDEHYKERNCKVCPNCDRIVQKVAGCDRIICGNYSHDGKYQGCKFAFSWEEAKPYRANTQEIEALIHAEENVPSNSPREVIKEKQKHGFVGFFSKLVRRRKSKVELTKPDGQHYIDEEKTIEVHCDICKKGIEGICIHCLNCPSVDICITCCALLKYGSYLNDNERPEVKNPPGHNSDHVCRILLPPSS